MAKTVQETRPRWRVSFLGPDADGYPCSMAESGHQHQQTGVTIDGPVIGPDFRWTPIACDDPGCFGVYLHQGYVLVACVSNLGGQWRTNVDMHRLRGAKTAATPNLKTGMRWVAKWAIPRQNRIVSECLPSQKPPTTPFR